MTAILAPTILGLDPTSDSGVSKSDDITNVAQPIITGTGTVGDTNTLYDNYNNLIAPSSAFDDPAWVPFTVNGTDPVVTPNVDPGPNGGDSTADQVTLTSANTGLYFQTSVAGTSTFSVWVRLISGDGNFALNYYGATTGQVYEPVVATSDWQQVSMSFTGDGNAGSNVALFHDSLQSLSGTFEFWGAQLTQTIGTTIVDANGNWSITPTTPLTGGFNALTATQSDGITVSPVSSALTVTLDTQAPVAPGSLTLTAASDSGVSNSDDITNVALPTITGTGEDGATVTLFDGSTMIGTGTVTNGAWSITATTALTEGANTITATQTDVAGNVSTASSVLNVTLDTSEAPPTALVLNPASDSGASSSDDITNAAMPTITGTGNDGDTVTLFDGSTMIGTGTVTAGAWSITATVALTEGANAITATQTDVAGNVSVASSVLNVTLDTSEGPPTALVLNPASDSGAFNSDDITNVAMPTITGTGNNGDTVTLFDGSTMIGTGTVAGGAWSITATMALTEGANAITATQIDVAGNASAASSVLNVTLDTQAPVAPGSLTLAPGNDSGNDVTNAAMPTFTGTGEAGATVTMFDGSTSVGTGTVDGLGNWSIAATGSLTQGSNTITATETDVAGNISATSSSLNVTLNTAPANFTILDTTTNVTTTSTGDAYTGPVAYLQHQIIDITADSLNITSTAPNSFLRSGSGMDGLNVSFANGDNILDGSTGSSFMTGGTGNDTFYMDDRDPTAPVFSTIVNFHAGDNATVWGVNATDFKMIALDNQGAAGFTGLDLIFTAPGHIDTSFVLAGYTSADLTNGRLSQSYGTTADLPGVPGSQYLTIHAN